MRSWAEDDKTDMKNEKRSEDRRKSRRHSDRLPLGYWETNDACYGGLVTNISETGLLICSIQDLPIGTVLGITVFYCDGDEFDLFKLNARIVWRDLRHENTWDGYTYGLEFVLVPFEDRSKLQTLLQS